MAQNENENGYGYGSGNSNEGIYGNYGSGYGGGYGGGGVYGGPNTLLDLTDILWKRKFGMLVIFIIVFGISVLITFSQTPVYQVFSSVMVKYGREFTYHGIDPKGDDDVRPQLAFNNDQVISTMLEVYRSSKVIEPVLRKLGVEKLFPKLSSQKSQDDVMPVAVARFRNKLGVSHIKGSKVISITFDHEDPEPAVEALKLLTEEFKNRHLEIFKNPKTSFLEKQAETLLNKFVEAENAVQEYKKQNGIFFLEDQRYFLADELTRARSLLIQSKGTAKRLAHKLASSQESMNNMAELSVVYETTADTQNLNEIRTQLLALQLQESNLLRHYPEDNRLVREKREQIKIAKDYLAKWGADAGNRQETTHSGKSYAYKQVEATVFQTLSDLKGAEAESNALEEEVASIEKRLAELTAKEMDLKRLELLAESAEKNYKNIIENLEDNRMLDILDQEKIVSIVDIETPVLPLKPVKPRKRVNLMIGLILAAASAFAYALLFEYSTLKKSASTEI